MTDSDRIPTGYRGADSYGRTDGLTETGSPCVDKLTLGSAQEEKPESTTSEPTAVSHIAGDVIDFLEAQGNSDARWPVYRTGEREPIRWAKRLAIYHRDGFQCIECGAARRESELQLDHVIPWSTGGSDRSDNLRSLCRRCNEARGNLNDGSHLQRLVPVTLWCKRCWPPETPDTCPAREFAPTTHINLVCPWRDARFAVEHRIYGDAATLAFCAHCGLRSQTDVVL